MSSPTRDLREAALRWPGVRPEADGVVRRIEAALGLAGPEVCEHLLAWLAAGGEGPHRARALVWDLGLAGLARCRIAGALPAGFARLVGPDGAAFALGASVLVTPAHEPGDPHDVARLVHALEGVMGRWRFVLYFARRLPPGIDPEPVARAVRLWLLAIDRGEWFGRHAVYEDGGVSLEISLVRDDRREDGPSLVFVVPPVCGLDRVGRAVDLARDAVLTLEESEPDLPIVLVLAADPAWRLPRGQVTQSLYGTPASIQTMDGQEPSFVATYPGSGQAVFADPAFRRLGALWWVEPAGQDPLGMRAWACENPWSERPGVVPHLPGARFAPRGAQVMPDAFASRPAEMAWSGRDRTVWSPRP